MSPIEPEAPRVDRGRELVSALLVALATGVFGVLLGFAWYLFAPTLPGRKVSGGLAYISPHPEEQVAQDGWFAILGVIFGVVAAVVAWLVVRRWRGPIQMAAVTLGALAAGYLGSAVGSQIDLEDYRQRVEAAELGAIVQKPVELSSTQTLTCVLDRCASTPGGPLLMPALGSAIAYALLAGWSRWPGLRGEQDEEVPFVPPSPVSSELEAGRVETGWPEQRGSQ